MRVRFIGRGLWLEAAVLAGVMALGVLSIRTIFREGVIPGWDNPTHLVCSHMTIEFLRGYTLLGWDPYNNFGWVFNQYYNPGAYMLVAGVYYLLAGAVDVNTAYKVAFTITYLLPGLGAYLLVRVSTGSGTAALLAALFNIVVLPQESEWFDAGLRQMYEIGMWPQRLGIGLALLSLSAFLAALKAPRLRWPALVSLAAILTTLTLLSHPVTGIGLAASITLVFACRAAGCIVNDRGGGFKAVSRRLAAIASTYAATGLLALGLAAFWLVPLLETNEAYHSLPLVRWQTGPWIYSHLTSSLGVVQLALLATAVSMPVARIGNPGRRTLFTAAVASGFLMWAVSSLAPYDGYIGLRMLFATAVFAVASLLTEEPAPMLASLASLLLLMATGPDSFRFSVLWWRVDLSTLFPFSEEYAYSKFAGLARYLILSTAAMGLGVPLQKLYVRVRGLKGPAAQAGYVAMGVVLLLVAMYYLGPHVQMTDLYYPYSEELHFKLDSDFPLTSEAKRVMDWVKANATRDTYVLYEDTLTKLGDWASMPVSHYFYLSSMAASQPQVGGGFGSRYITHPLANTEGQYIFGRPISWLAGHPEGLAEILRELGISYLVVTDQGLVNAMGGRPDLFKEMGVVGPFHIFRTAGINPIATMDNGSVKSLELRFNEIVIECEAQRDAYIYIRQVYYPGWSVAAGVAELGSYNPGIAPYVLTDEGPILNYRVPFMRLKVPAGAQRLVLRYDRRTWGDAASLATIIALLAVNIAAPLYLRAAGGNPRPKFFNG